MFLPLPSIVFLVLTFFKLQADYTIPKCPKGTQFRYVRSVLEFDSVKIRPMFPDTYLFRTKNKILMKLLWRRSHSKPAETNACNPILKTGKK